MAMLWGWCWGLALVGTWGYFRLYAPDWRNRYCLLYDVPTLPVAFAFAGETLYWLLTENRAEAWPRLAALLLAVGCAAGAQYRSWPLSGHLTVAVTVGVLTAADDRNALLWRLLALLPIVLLIGIRTFRPQSALMGDRANTRTGIVLGLLIGGSALVLSALRVG